MPSRCVGEKRPGWGGSDPESWGLIPAGKPPALPRWDPRVCDLMQDGRSRVGPTPAGGGPLEKCRRENLPRGCEDREPLLDRRLSERKKRHAKKQTPIFRGSGNLKKRGGGGAKRRAKQTSTGRRISGRGLREWREGRLVSALICQGRLRGVQQRKGRGNADPVTTKNFIGFCKNSGISPVGGWLESGTGVRALRIRSHRNAPPRGGFDFLGSRCSSRAFLSAIQKQWVSANPRRFG